MWNRIKRQLLRPKSAELRQNRQEDLTYKTGAHNAARAFLHFSRPRKLEINAIS